ncbi:MAG: hypothetical protein GY938_25835 [Ketobacter sp.]|nr:hypothetical protein [Ketobacter sp.]
MTDGIIPVIETQADRSRGLVRVLSNKDIDEAERTQKEADEERNTPFVIGVVSELQNKWQAAKTSKWTVEEKLLQNKRQRKGRYDPSDFNDIQNFGGSRIFMMLTSVKCRAIEAWVKDIMLPAGEKPWGVDPTPVPDLPVEIELEIASRVADEVQQIAVTFGPTAITEELVQERIEEVRQELKTQMRERIILIAKRNETRMEDELIQGRFYEEFSKFIRDFSTYLTAFMVGPEIKKRAHLVWKNGKPEMEWKFRREWRHVSPFDIYPAPAAKDFDDGYVFERMRVRRTALMQYRGSPNFSTAAIDAVLNAYNLGTLKDWLWTDQEQANLSDRPTELLDPDAVIETLVYRGEMQGHKLREWGVPSDQVPNPAQDYEVEAWMVDNWIIMVRMNKHPLKKRGLYYASFEEENDSIWGHGPPEIMEDCQRICNASARQIVNNMAIASGPQVEVHADRVDPKEDIEDIYPWKVWRTKSDELGRNRQAVHFYQPNPMVDMLMKVYEYFFKQAGEQLGVPAYEHGSPNVGGAGKTAHGLAMLMSSSSKIMRQAIKNIDGGVIVPLIHDLWIHMMMFSNKMERGGDINIIARASEYLIIAEQLQLRRTEFLAMINNPTDQAIIGNVGRGKILREVIKDLKLPMENVVPNDEELMAREQQMMMMPPEMAGGGGIQSAGGGGGPRGGGGPPPPMGTSPKGTPQAAESLPKLGALT